MNDERADAQIARAASAHREERHGRSERAASTRARVLATHRETTRRTTLWLAAAAALVVFVGAPTAWAWSTGRLSRWLASEEDAATTEPRARTPLEPAPERDRSEVVPDRPQPSAPEETGRELSLPDLETIEPRRDPSEAEARPSDLGEDDRAPADPRERRAFQRADALHTARDFDAALIAWDAYLGEYPEGRFAIEARYERALCLLRLGRNDEARQALVPFAEGRFGRYRERDARALLDALASEAPAP
jgi:hypothetical protein